MFRIGNRRGNIIVDLGRAEAILPVREQVPRESYRAGDRIEAFSGGQFGIKVDVISEGMPIERGQAVVVVKTRSNRVVVRAADA